MNYDLIELRRERDRKETMKSKTREALECAAVFIFSLCMFFAVVAFFGIIWLTDPAYGCDKTYAEVLNVDGDDYADLCAIVSAEAGDETMDGQMAVVEVIGNRILSESFPDTVHEVLSQRGQFSTWKNRYKHPIMQEHIDAVENVRLGEDSAISKYINDDLDPTEYVYFCTPAAYKRIGHRYMHNIITIGGHVFGTM